MAAAVNGEAYRAAIAAATDGHLDRPKRQQIFIEYLNGVFEANLDDPEATKVKEDLSGETGVKEIKGEKRYGFLITLRGTTPNDGRVGFVTDAFKKRLRELGRQPEQGLYINRIWLTKFESMTPSATPAAGESEHGAQPAPRGGRRPSTRPPAVPGAPGAPGAPGTPGAPGADRSKELIDPLTNEVMNSDSRFELVFDVVLEDLPKGALEDKPAGGEAPTDSGRGN